ncbi:TetR family transcriptional regulator C-terminal domain-containing protein [Muriicola sp. Z0-33]|uniref:TetR family transcriptional regulator C-terminal domain-containing protein n=1 Tax=Muriicola sp. Z0-33 TaxID=2816957 RepID=UPI002237D7A6|nr:TetR family transcriptional regulator C-terminal domain-containing protein [Muriicola sp. Z0-33]MCW5517380.1 TetR/AcrR family transcriptional regulator [Muriicola sp. Z0-33]
MNAKNTKTKNSESAIISLYMDYVLKEEKIPKSVYKFCQLNNLEEEEFYNYFGSFSGLHRAIWTKFFDSTHELMKKNKEFQGFSNKDKMLTFFFSFFELLALNRSYILFALDNERNLLRSSAQLKTLRTRFKEFATDLIIEGSADATIKVLRKNPGIFSEGAWIQLVVLLKFWIDDDSPGFEKTDMAIEKSVNTVFELIDNSPIERILDLSKFLYKEKFT